MSCFICPLFSILQYTDKRSNNIKGFNVYKSFFVEPVKWVKDFINSAAPSQVYTFEYPMNTIVTLCCKFFV